MEQKITFEQYKQELKEHLKKMKDDWNRLLVLCSATPFHLDIKYMDFDTNEILCAPNTADHFNNTFQECSLGDLEFESWVNSLIQNIDHWKQGEWIQDDSWNKEED